MRVPRETAAFAAGLAVCVGNWHVIAATLSQIGLGTFRPEELRAAADDWCETNTRREAVPLQEAIAATMPGRPA